MATYTSTITGINATVGYIQRKNAFPCTIERTQIHSQVYPSQAGIYPMYGYLRVKMSIIEPPRLMQSHELINV